MGQPLNKFFTDEEEVLNTVEKVILFFREQGKAGERLSDTIKRVGFDVAEKEILSDDILARKAAILED
jgi:dissimilatory sulfite reductase (desulfoviridin) alpha/beta subunit